MLLVFLCCSENVFMQANHTKEIPQGVRLENTKSADPWLFVYDLEDEPSNPSVCNTLCQPVSLVHSITTVLVLSSYFAKFINNVSLIQSTACYIKRYLLHSFLFVFFCVFDTHFTPIRGISKKFTIIVIELRFIFVDFVFELHIYE